MRLVLMGTPEFATESLKCLNASKHDVMDKPRGRGRKIMPSAVKETALELGLPIYQPTNFKSNEFIDQLTGCNPDLNVVVAFRILPESVYSLPRFGSINLHASLLPKYRGAAPINWALINGETKTGLTTFLLDKKVDTGDLLLQSEIEITADDNFGSLHDKLMTAGAELLLETIDGLESGRLKSRVQSQNGVSPAPKLTSLAENSAEDEPGTVIESSPGKGITIACGEDALAIDQLKPQGKRLMGSAEYVRGYHVKVGDRFGD